MFKLKNNLKAIEISNFDEAHKVMGQSRRSCTGKWEVECGFYGLLNKIISSRAKTIILK